MRRQRKKQQNQIEYIPLHPEDVKYATSVPVKQLREEELIKIEKPGIIKSKRKRKIDLKTRTIREEIELEIEKPETETKGKYTLIITEKPAAALKIATALGTYKKFSENNVPYYELERDNKKIIVACAVGHLFTLTSKEKGYPIFNIEWQPNFKVKKHDWSKKYYSLLLRLVKNANEFIIATDYDIEGEVIGLNIIRFIAKTNQAKRMKFSTLTSQELQESYEKIMPTIDWGQAIAGETRHFLDWMYGINLSRALMSTIQKAGSFKIMSVGRVQGPALNLIVQKELEIQNFKSQTYWQIFIKLKNHQLELKYEKDIWKKQELDEFKNLEGKKGIATTEKILRKLIPPFPFDLTSLQREAYRLFGINPSRTLQLAQKLYLAGLISYPRTSSQKIPESISPRTILNKLSKFFKETKFVFREKPIEGKKSDPAHPSVYPTGEFSSLNKEEEKIYNLIVKRFIACFCLDAEIEDKKIVFICENKKFIAKGLEIREKGWMNVYPSFLRETEIEDINGEKIIEKKRIEEKQTQPPRRYTPASIITELEKRNLGTKATRASIIETLYNRNYITEQSIIATPLGISLISALSRYSPIIIDEKLTRHFEKEMEQIQTAKKNFLVLENKTIKEAKETITKISDDLKKNEDQIGKELVKANQEIYKQEREANTLTLCEKCKKGNLRILFNKKFRRYFVACSNYPECKTTFSLPPGLIKPTGKLCEKCGFPLLLRIQKGRKPWEFCFNPNCESRKQN